MSELEIYYLATLIRNYTVGLCLGVFSIAMTFYFYVVATGRMDKFKNIILNIVYTVLRVGIALVMVAELTMLIYNYHVNNFIYWTNNPELLIRLTIFSVIFANAIAIQYRKITIWLGSVLAGGSWYGYFFFSVWGETETQYPILLAGYLSWLMIFGFCLTLLRFFLTCQQKGYLGEGAMQR